MYLNFMLSYNNKGKCTTGYVKPNYQVFLLIIQIFKIKIKFASMKKW